MANAVLHRLLGHLRKVAATSPAELTDRELLERFAQRGDQAAFAAMVERHGALVYGVCRRLLGDQPDADDVFQATFIVLARKAGGLHWHESIGPWLHAVAVRLARKVIADAARRNRVEQHVQPRSAADPVEDILRQELYNVLDAELHQLSQRHRAPLILCYLEGQTLGGAAQQLGWSLGTLKRRLERGRRLLRQRLVRRGLAPSAVTLAAALTEANAHAAVPATLIAATVRLALLLQTSDTVMRSAALALADAMMKSFLMSKVKLAGAGLAVAGLLAVAAGVLARPGAESKRLTQPSSQPEVNAPGEAQPADRRAESLPGPIAARLASGSDRPADQAPGDKAGDVLTIAGRVLDTEGKPFAGAELYVTVKSAIHEAPRLKDPKTKIYETRIVNGRNETFIVHPKVIALMKKHGLDPAKPINGGMFEDPKLESDLHQVMQELYEDHPFQMPKPQASSGPDGRFRFTLTKSWLKQAPHEEVEVLAFAKGFGPGWAWAASDEGLTDLTVRLVKDVPINGRIVDLQGRPVAGATVRLGSIMAGPDGTATIWTQLVEASASDDSNRHNELLNEILKRQMLTTNLTRIPKSAVTDKDGRFRFSGIGADRVVFRVQVTGANVGNDQFSVMTRAETGIRIPRGGPALRAEYRTYPASFEHVMNPVQVLAGTVRDRATGKPIEGVQVAAWGPAYIDSFTDKDGRYHLVGLAKAKEYTVTFWPYGRTKARFLNTTIRVSDRLGLGPLIADVGLVRGVVLRGRLTDKATGKGVGGAMISYATFKDNPHSAPFAFSGNPNFNDPSSAFPDLPQLQQTHTNSRPDGKFEMVVLPGRGLLGVHVSDGPYVAADLPEARKDRFFWSKLVPYIANSAEEFQAVKLIDVPEKAAETSCDLQLDPGRSLKGRILDPDGRPLAGVKVTGLNVQEFHSLEPLRTADFTVTGLSPGRTRLLGFYLPEKQLGALARVQADQNGPLAVTLQKCGTLTGRVVDAEGRPRSSVRLWGLLAERGNLRPEGRGHDLSGMTDKDGKFRVEGVVPSEKYDLFTFEGPANMNGKVLGRALQVAPGENKNLGDVPVLKALKS